MQNSDKAKFWSCVPESLQIQHTKHFDQKTRTQEDPTPGFRQRATIYKLSYRQYFSNILAPKLIAEVLNWLILC